MIFKESNLVLVSGVIVNNLVYIIYILGLTGNLKGVMIEYYFVINCL